MVALSGFVVGGTAIGISAKNFLNIENNGRILIEGEDEHAKELEKSERKINELQYEIEQNKRDWSIEEINYKNKLEARTRLLQELKAQKVTLEGGQKTLKESLEQQKALLEAIRKTVADLTGDGNSLEKNKAQLSEMEAKIIEQEGQIKQTQLEKEELEKTNENIQAEKGKMQQEKSDLIAKLTEFKNLEKIFEIFTKEQIALDQIKDIDSYEEKVKDIATKRMKSTRELRKQITDIVATLSNEIRSGKNIKIEKSQQINGGGSICYEDSREDVYGTHCVDNTR